MGPWWVWCVYFFCGSKDWSIFGWQYYDGTSNADEVRFLWWWLGIAKTNARLSPACRWKKNILIEYKEDRKDGWEYQFSCICSNTKRKGKTLSSFGGVSINFEGKWWRNRIFGHSPAWQCWKRYIKHHLQCQCIVLIELPHHVRSGSKKEWLVSFLAKGFWHSCAIRYMCSIVFRVNRSYLLLERGKKFTSPQRGASWWEKTRHQKTSELGCYTQTVQWLYLT